MELKPKFSETQKWEDALKHICPEGQTLLITTPKSIVKIGFTTETEGKETPFARHSEDRLTEIYELYFFA